MSSSIPRVMALAPDGSAGSGIVIAAGRAGALGVLDFGWAFDADAAGEATNRVVRYLDRPFGLRLPSGSLRTSILDRAPNVLGVLIGTEPADGDWTGPLAFARSSGRKFVAEVTSRALARSAAEAGVDGLIIAGHEASGPGSDESSFILLQGVLAQGGPPVWVRGGIGPQSAAACVASGAAGVVLEGALLLARESPLSDEARERVGRWDGGETVVVRRGTRSFRLHVPLGSADPAAIEVGWRDGQAWPVGQDAALAGGLARRFVTTGGIVQAVERAMDELPRLARTLRPLAEGSTLAASHGTRYPIVQGPMTRVSDTAAFALAVADGGALPFLALAMLRGPEARALLAETVSRLDGRPWGVGILGFVPPDLRLEQIAAIREVRPPFALIAGGRPDQARELDREGIATYLHVPSPGLLRQYLQDGARRFVLEGRECGGHVGPRSSFVLWEQALEVIGEAIDRGIPADSVHLLFAGGIHDARSSAIVATLAAPLVGRGVRVGVLIGTAYLFTEEAVATGAIVPGFQAEAVRCAGTVLLVTGPGHEVRVAPSPFARTFDRERQRLMAEGRTAAEVRAALERLNAGRLRVAAKGVDRALGAATPLIPITPDDQHARGIYMLGQVATLRDRVTTIADLHREIAEGSADWLDRALDDVDESAEIPARPSDIAIVGMAAIMPGAADCRTFWENTLRGVDAITEVPADRWDWRLYFDPDPKAPDRITSKWGGFLPDVPFDPLRYGMPPSSLPSIEPMQLLVLEAVRAAIDDAGYRDRPFPRERTAVILGAGGGAAQLAMGYAFRSYLPLLDTALPGAGSEALAHCGALLPEWTEDSFPGILLNVAAGRVANRFDLGGTNYTVDAACGSSLAAAALAVRELEVGAADVVILGGADTVQNPFTYLAFSKTHAFSPRGRCRPFDTGADGIVISEGVAALILKRLADAERDGDRIYAVIKGLGASSDGRARGLTAPRPEGQVSALTRAYAKAGVPPDTVGYVEAHGTGTAAGDLAEVGALTDVFARAGAKRGRCALGSVKSSIGHTKCAAGLAGLINASLALYHEVLPPTIGVENPNPKVDPAEGPFHISARTRPWLHGEPGRPRRAGVSAFGFGGTNFHAVLEAHDRDPAPVPSPIRDWPAELLVWRAHDHGRLVADLDRWLGALKPGAGPALRDLAHTAQTSAKASMNVPTLAIVATTLDDLRGKLTRGRKAIVDGLSEVNDPSGVYFAERPALAGSKVAFLFPGQGAQYPEMLAELAIAFAEVRRGFETTDAALNALGRAPIGPKVFPPPAFRDDRDRQRAALLPPDVAQPSVGAACLGMLGLLDALGLKADQVAGHSFGELVALHAAGTISAEALAGLAEARGRLLMGSVGDEPGAMAALAAGPDRVRSILDGLAGVDPVNFNGPGQTVISGTQAAVEAGIERARQAGIRVQLLPVACAFHSPLVAAASGPLTDLARSHGLAPPRRPVYSNVTAAPYPDDPVAIADQLGDHLARPVRFAEMIEAMYADGARTFIEVGPGTTLAPLVGAILGGRSHLALSLDRPGRPGLPGLLHALGVLAVVGVPIRLERLTAGRSTRRLDLDRLGTETEPLTPSTWLVNGTRARPAFADETARFGQGPALPPPAPTHADAPTTRTRSLRPASLIGGLDPVIEAFQETMRSFLEVQRTTMLGFLAGREAPRVDPCAPIAPRPHLMERREKHVRVVEAEGIVPRNGRLGDPGHSVLGPGRPAPVPSSNGHVPPSGLESEIRNPKSDRPPVPDRVSISARLLRIVQERTGYPAEMLGLGLDLEADLGIDSIKRVEILGSLREALPELPLGSDSATMDALSNARTLGAIVEKLGKVARPESVEDVKPSEPVRRLVVEAVESPLPKRSAGLLAGGVVLVTDDGRRIARDVAADLRASGHPVVRVRHGASAGEIEGADLTSAESVSALLDRVRRRGPLAGIVHALPLREAPRAGLDARAWSARMGPEVKGLFLLAQSAADDLGRAASRGGACLIAATGLGGAFASVGGPPADFFPGQGGIAGLVKTLAREWPTVRVRVVDFDPSVEVEVLAADLVHEVLTEDGRSEVGYLAGRRVALRTVATPLRATPEVDFELSPGSPVLVTGGARGITAAVAADLARRWRPTLLLVGSSPAPPDEEDQQTAGLRSPAEVKSALLARLRGRGDAVGPADVERAYQAHRREREIRANLRTLREAGSQVHYAQADVRDAEALGRVLAGWRDRFGPPVGLIHGAGVIQDKLLRDKTPESFDRVLGTKVEGALTLARLIQPETLKFAAFFSSVAGRFGNRGQADYAAANEALNKLAIWLDRRWSCRVVSLIWGPWSGVGMVSDLEGHLGRRGLAMISPESGRTRLADELRLGSKGNVEVVVAAGDLGPLEDKAGPLAEGGRP